MLGVPVSLLLASLLPLLAEAGEAGVLASCKDVNGDLHKLGEAYIGPDGCNRCKCMEGGSACTKKLCPETMTSREAEANKCVDNKGVLHEVGSSFTHVDGCNTCKCMEGGGACTRRFCLKDATCEGGERKEGESWTHRDGCNKCQCSIFGTVCSEMLCASLQQPKMEANSEEGDTREKSGSQTCLDSEGTSREAGKDWLTPDSCNICQCLGNSTVPLCTKMGCRVRLERLIQSSEEGSGASPLLLSSLLLPLLLLAANY